MRVEHLNGTHADFRGVETLWQPVTGIWKLHTGLTCIAWDHWITAFGAPRRPAFLCEASASLRNVVVTARVSEASEGFETRTHIHHPMHDIAVVLRAREEAPLHSGYRIVVAPLPAKDTVVLHRAGVEVARMPSFRIKMGSHCNSPRMLTVVARAIGGRVRCEVNGRLAMDWTDPDPLPAGCVMLGAEKGRANFADVSVLGMDDNEAPRIDRPMRSLSGL